MDNIYKIIRTIAKLNQEQFANELGTTTLSINRWENGKTEPNRMAQKQLFRFCLEHEINLGELIVRTKEYGNQMVDGIFALMKDLGIWDGDAITPREPIISSDPDDVSYLNASVGGLFVPEVHHWEELKTGDVIGKIIDPLSGKVLDEIKSPVDGILFTIREYPIVDEGSLVGRLLRKEAYKK